MTTNTQIFILAATFFTGLGTCAALTPSVAAFAYRLGALDVPRDARRMHRDIVPRLGGMGVLLSAVLAGAAMGGGRFFAPLLTGGFVLAAVGVTDDTYTLSPTVKLGGQAIAAMAAVLLGAYPTEVTVLGIRFAMQPTVAMALAVLWMLVLINAVNFIDGLDGLASGFGMISHAAVAIMLTGSGGAVLPLAMSGACAGFLFHNRAPARIFLGDTGAMLIGFSLAAITATGALPLEVVLLVVVYPLTDLALSVLRRVRAGESPFHADRGHIHHKLVDSGISVRGSVRLLLDATAATCALAVVAFFI